MIKNKNKIKNIIMFFLFLLFFIIILLHLYKITFV